MGRKADIYLAQLLIVVAHTQQELERLFMTKNGCPSQRCVPFWAWIWVSHIRSLDHPLDEEEVVLCSYANVVSTCLRFSPSVVVPLTARLKRMVRSFSAILRDEAKLFAVVAGGGQGERRRIRMVTVCGSARQKTLPRSAVDNRVGSRASIMRDCRRLSNDISNLYLSRESRHDKRP